jgi:hypothetical protein
MRFIFSSIFDLEEAVFLLRTTHFDDGLKLMVDDFKNSPSIMAKILVKVSSNDSYIRGQMQTLVPEELNR